jgi:hypothetical protein
MYLLFSLPSRVMFLALAAAARWRSRLECAIASGAWVEIVADIQYSNTWPYRAGYGLSVGQKI